jgi:hypothetical protein
MCMSGGRHGPEGVGRSLLYPLPKNRDENLLTTKLVQLFSGFLQIFEKFLSENTSVLTIYQ